MTTNRPGTWTWYAVPAALVISTAVGCAGHRHVGQADPREPGSAGSPSALDETTRGMHVEQGRPGFDHALQVRRSKTAAPHELHDGDTVMTGDRIRAAVTTSEDAYLYLAFCAGHELAIYPSQRGVRTRAGTLMLVPEGGGEIVLDGDPGPEVLYLIVSRRELALADPPLAGELAAMGHGAKVVDCGAASRARPHPQPPADPDPIRSPGNGVLHDASSATGPRDVTATGLNGIAVVRYGFTHIAPASP